MIRTRNDPLLVHRPSSWKDRAHQRHWMDRAAEKLGVQLQSEWYDVSLSSLRSLGGGGLLSRYKGSVWKALRILYSEYDWNPLLFRNIPRHSWSDRRICVQ